MAQVYVDEERKENLEDKLEYIESVAYPGFSDEDADILFRYEGTKGKKVIRKIDLHLLPVLAFLYLCSHVDRNNMGNAKIEGMNDDLGLVGNQYNIASTLFFVPYIIFGMLSLSTEGYQNGVGSNECLEIPSNIVLKKTRPSFWLSLQVVTWGIVMACMGAVKGFASLTACRVLLGICEVSRRLGVHTHQIQFHGYILCFFDELTLTLFRQDSSPVQCIWSLNGIHHTRFNNVSPFYIPPQRSPEHLVAFWLTGLPTWMAFRISRDGVGSS